MSKKVFSADVAQLLKLVTHSIYSNKEIFIRELIANANDAIQKAKILAASDPQYLGDQVDLSIRITIDKDTKTLKIHDSGIGMTMQNVEDHIGTIAQSGTKSFVEKLKDMKDADNNLVGQFGIGFYSAFMVADKVEIHTKSNDSDTGVHWTSDGSDSYEIEACDKMERGTMITLHITDENKEFLEGYRIRHLVRTYADYIPVPIMMLKEKKETENKETNEDESAKSPSDQNAKSPDYEQINQMTAIWQKNKKDVTPDEYTKHFQSLAMSMDEPLDTIHLNIEGNINYKAVLYIPKKTNPRQDINDPSKDYGPALYVQNVMIMKNAKELLPAWLRHIVGVVQTPDLPLNVSREILQQSSIMSKIQSSLVKEVIKSLTYLKKEHNSDYIEYFSHFARLTKEGVYYDNERREEIAGLLYFAHSSITKEESPSLIGEGLGGGITLDTYIEQNKDNLKGLTSIYYLHTPSSKEGAASPHMHKCIKRDLDVIYMTDPIDEYMLTMMRTYKDYSLVNIASSDAVMPELEGEVDHKKDIEKSEKKHKKFLDFVTNTIGNDILEKVSFGHDLGDSLAVLNTPDGQPTAQMVKMYKAMGQNIPQVKKTLIINADHNLVKKYIKEYESDTDNAKSETLVSYLYDQAILLEGGEIESISAFLQKANTLIS